MTHLDARSTPVTRAVPDFTASRGSTAPHGRSFATSMPVLARWFTWISSNSAASRRVALRRPSRPPPYAAGRSTRRGGGGRERTYSHRVTNKEFFSRRNAQLAWALKLRAQRTGRLLAGEDVPP